MNKLKKIILKLAAFDVLTTASLLKEMPLVRTVEVGKIHSPEDMTFLISALCDACWQLHQVKFPDSCEWHPSAQDLHQLSYYHPRITCLHMATKQKLTPAEIAGLGAEIACFPFLRSLKLVGFYWHQPELVPEVLGQVESLHALSLPSVPGLSGTELAELSREQPNLKCLTLNTSSLTGNNLKFTNFRLLKDLKIIDNSVLSGTKVVALSGLTYVTSLDLNLSNCSKNDVLALFGTQRPTIVELLVSNCGFSDELISRISQFCTSLRRLIWHNPKDAHGELTDTGLFAITKLPLLHSLEVKSRSVTKTHYPDLAGMRSLHYARINGMRVPGCL